MILGIGLCWWCSVCRDVKPHLDHTGMKVCCCATGMPCGNTVEVVPALPIQVPVAVVAQSVVVPAALGAHTVATGRRDWGAPVVEGYILRSSDGARAQAVITYIPKKRGWHAPKKQKGRSTGGKAKYVCKEKDRW